MPDITWNRSFFRCRSFGPDAEGNALDRDGIFRCRDLGELSEYWQYELRWGFDGRNLGHHTGDLPSPPYKIRGSRVIIGIQ